MLATTSSDWVNYLLAVFLLITGLTLGFALYKLADVFARLASFIRGAEREMMPVIHSAGGTVDRVNAQLDQIEPATASAVDAVEAVDEAVRAVSFVVKRPIEKLVGLSAGASHGWATFKAKRSLGEAMRSGKEASARREADFEDELHHPEQFGSRATPPTAASSLATPARATPTAAERHPGERHRSGRASRSPGSASSGSTAPSSSPPSSGTPESAPPGSTPASGTPNSTPPSSASPTSASSGSAAPSEAPPEQH